MLMQHSWGHNMFSVGDNVSIHKTGSALDGATGRIVGWYTDEYPIVLFDCEPPEGYNPAIVISRYCLQGEQ